MTAKTRPIKRFRLKPNKFRLLERCFASECSSSQTSKIILVNRKTSDRYFNFFRALIINQAIAERAEIDIKDGIEIDESYFGPTRQRGKKGRGAYNKILVLGLRKRNSKVFTEVIPDATKREIMPIILKVVKSGSDIYTDGWRSYDALAVYGYNHKKVKHEGNEFVTGENHINGIESFWSYTKRRLAKFNGVKKEHFTQHLLESEWRFNHRNTTLKDLRNLIKLYKV